MNPRIRPALVATVALALLALPRSLPAADLQGADAVLRRLAEDSAAPVAPAGNELSALRALIDSYRAESASLPPEAAAVRWLALFDGFTRLPDEAFYRQSYHDRLSAGTIIESLPPPASWDALAAAIRARTEKASTSREVGLRLLGTVIAGDSAAQRAVLDQLRAAVKTDKKIESYQLDGFLAAIDKISDAITASAGDSARLAAFDRELGRIEKPGSNRPSSLSIPDLVRVAGRPSAEPLLLRALRLDAELHLWGAGEHTRRALSELALKNIDQLKRPQWSLVTSLDDVALYEAMDKRFPAADSAEEERNTAKVVYLLGLVASGRTADATALVFDPETRFDRSALGFGYGDPDVFAQLQRAGRGDAVLDFLREVLARDPALPFWDAFIAISAQQSRAREALALFRAVLAKPELPSGEASALRARYFGALLAADEIDEGLAVLRSLVAEDRRAASSTSARSSAAAGAPVPSTSALVSSSSIDGVSIPQVVVSAEELKAKGGDVSGEIVTALESGGIPVDASAGSDEEDDNDVVGERVKRIDVLIRLGRLLEKPELVAEGLAAGRDILPRLGERDLYQGTFLVKTMVDALDSLGRGDEAESLLVDRLLQLARQEKGNNRSQTQAVLIQLAALYGKAGRHADVLRLYTGSPDLGASDLSEISLSSCREIDASAHLQIADALIASGRADEARRILRRIVLSEPGCDDAYARLEKLGGPDYAALLEQAAGLDRFEERPLIWKARLQLAAGDLVSAEKTIRAAIAIDPSDGEQGKNDRMRAYAVLGDILEKAGDSAQAATMRGAVAAIRLSEQADDWWAAGLLTRAVGLYEKSLLKFADAYCIQSRLALRYNELGDFAKAEEHYRRAFELMPDSFGRVESHCFGCEGAFSGARAQNVADKVFTRLAAEASPRAQVFYLLGYLRSAQERPEEAADNFRKAVALDPDYLNAWEKLQELAGAVYLPAAERETAALAILRLDPAGKRTSPKFDGISDLRKLWGAVLAAEASLPPVETGPLFAFPAAKAKIEAKKKNADANEFPSFMHWQSQPRNLREHLSDNDLFSATIQFIEQTLGR